MGVTLTEKAPAKINLSLEIIRKRPDGYHDLKTTMASVSLYDGLTVTLTPCEAGAESFTASAAGVAGGNLAAEAARLFMETAGLAGWSVHTDIEKRIPISAGLGGGSSDAAALLRALNKWRSVPQKTLEAIALEIGSDVPYCLRGGVCLAGGRGEKLEELPPLPMCRIVLVTPEAAVSAAEMFRLFDRLGAPERRSDNVFEDIIPLPEVAQIKRALIQAGADKASMSGSGPTVFGIFNDHLRANKAFDNLQAQFPKTFMTIPV